MSKRPDVRRATNGPPTRRWSTATSIRAIGFLLGTRPRQRLLEEGRGCFYAAEPDSDSESDIYDPTRECFNIDGEVETTDETQDAVAGGRAPVAREDPRTPGNNGQVNPRGKKTKPRNMRSYGNSKQS